MLITVTVLKWDKYYRKGDRRSGRNNWWFSLNNNFVTDPDFSTWLSEERLAWIGILSLCSKKQNGTVLIDTSSYAKGMHIKQSSLENAIKKAVELQVLRANDSQMPDKCQTKDWLQDRTEQNITEHPSEIPGRTCAEVTSRDPVVFNGIRVKRSAYEAWLNAFNNEEDWVRGEIKKAVAWIEVNPRKRPKVFERFMMNWLNRAWEQYRKSLPSNKPKTDIATILAKKGKL